jgi:hypothetical protein
MQAEVGWCAHAALPWIQTVGATNGLEKAPGCAAGGRVGSNPAGKWSRLQCSFAQALLIAYRQSAFAPALMSRRERSSFSVASMPAAFSSAS